MTLRGWEKLTCDCGSLDFVALHTLTWHEGQGTAQKTNGWQCAGCHKKVSTAKLISAVQGRHLQQKIAELEAQRDA